MSQFYIEPEREYEEHALPDGEVFFMSSVQFMTADDDSWMGESMRNHNDLDQLSKDLEGWYWWACFPGCLPDGEPSGPFETEQAAIEDAQQ